MISINRLVKSYGEHKVVNIDNLDIKKGNIFALLGPNAAGKTTTIKILSTLIPADEIDVIIDNYDLSSQKDSIKKKIGYVAQNFGLYAELSVIDNIRFYASLYGVDDELRFEQLMHKYQISHFATLKAGELSGGYKRRLALVCALAHDPDVIFLDEPTAGIDPTTRKELWDLFYELSTQGKTLFVTTHYMEEASRCHQIAFLNHGRVIAKGTPKEIQNSLPEYDVYIYEGEFEYEMLKTLKSLKDIYLINQFGFELRMLIKKGADTGLIKDSMKPFIESEPILNLSHANLEDVFIALTQEEKE